jgi:hypothetical protein
MDCYQYARDRGAPDYNNGVYNEEDDSYNEEEDDSDNEEEEEEEEEMGMGWGAEEDLGAEDLGYPYD